MPTTEFSTWINGSDAAPWQAPSTPIVEMAVPAEFHERQAAMCRWIEVSARFVEEVVPDGTRASATAPEGFSLGAWHRGGAGCSVTLAALAVSCLVPGSMLSPSTDRRWRRHRHGTGARALGERVRRGGLQPGIAVVDGAAPRHQRWPARSPPASWSSWRCSPSARPDG